MGIFLGGMKYLPLGVLDFLGLSHFSSSISISVVLAFPFEGRDLSLISTDAIFASLSFPFKTGNHLTT